MQVHTKRVTGWFVLFDLILYAQVNNFSAMLGRSSWVEPVLYSG